MGLVSLQGNFTSLTSRWFRYKHKKKTESKFKKFQTNNDVYIHCVILIKMKCNQGEIESIEYYRVLGIFRKQYNKWFINIDSDRIMRKKDGKS